MSHSRRNLLRALSVGGVVGATQLPASWSKPVVDAVVLPAHAQTTGGYARVLQFPEKSINALAQLPPGTRFQLIQG